MKAVGEVTAAETNQSVVGIQQVKVALRPRGALIKHGMCICDALEYRSFVNQVIGIERYEVVLLV